MTDEAQIDQAPEQSITEKIASKFGFPQQSTEGTDDVSSTPATEDGLADLEWEGLTFRAPIKVKEALMRNEDYTRKTQELAEGRRSIDHVSEIFRQRQMDNAFNESVAAEHNDIAVIDAYLSQASKLDWSQMTTDQMLRHKVEVDNIKERRTQLQQAVEAKRAKFNDEVKAKINELRGKSRELASKSINGFSEQTEKAVRDFALSEGLTETEIDNVLLDPRSFKIIWKAAQFDKIAAGTGKAADAATKAEKILKPGAASDRMPQEVVNKLNFRKAMKGATTSGEKANVIEQRLASVFK